MYWDEQAKFYLHCKLNPIWVFVMLILLSHSAMCNYQISVFCTLILSFQYFIQFSCCNEKKGWRKVCYMSFKLFCKLYKSHFLFQFCLLLSIDSCPHLIFVLVLWAWMDPIHCEEKICMEERKSNMKKEHKRMKWYFSIWNHSIRSSQCILKHLTWYSYLLNYF